MKIKHSRFKGFEKGFVILDPDDLPSNTPDALLNWQDGGFRFDTPRVYLAPRPHWKIVARIDNDPDTFNTVLGLVDVTFSITPSGDLKIYVPWKRVSQIWNDYAATDTDAPRFRYVVEERLVTLRRYVVEATGPNDAKRILRTRKEEATLTQDAAVEKQWLTAWKDAR